MTRPSIDDGGHIVLETLADGLGVVDGLGFIRCDQGGGQEGRAVQFELGL